MSGLSTSSEPSESSEYMLLERDQYELRPVDISMTAQNNIWIDPNVLKLKHRIGRGPYGDVWIATQHQRTNDYDHYHEVAVKMLYPIKDDQIPTCLAKFEELYTKCQGIDTVCHLEGVTIQNGRVSHSFLDSNLHMEVFGTSVVLGSYHEITSNMFYDYRFALS